MDENGLLFFSRYLSRLKKRRGDSSIIIRKPLSRREISGRWLVGQNGKKQYLEAEAGQTRVTIWCSEKVTIGVTWLLHHWESLNQG